MRIASGLKEKEAYSRAYRRKLTGAKGIGRFAVRFLGKHLTLDSIAFDRGRKSKTRLIASFDWSKFDKVADLQQVKVPYKLYKVPNKTSTGTSA